MRSRGEFRVQPRTHQHMAYGAEASTIFHPELLDVPTSAGRAVLQSEVRMLAWRLERRAVLSVATCSHGRHRLPDRLDQRRSTHDGDGGPDCGHAVIKLLASNFTRGRQPAAIYLPSRLKNPSRAWRTVTQRLIAIRQRSHCNPELTLVMKPVHPARVGGRHRQSQA